MGPGRPTSSGPGQHVPSNGQNRRWLPLGTIHSVRGAASSAGVEDLSRLAVQPLPPSQFCQPGLRRAQHTVAVGRRGVRRVAVRITVRVLQACSSLLSRGASVGSPIRCPCGHCRRSRNIGDGVVVRFRRGYIFNENFCRISSTSHEVWDDPAFHVSLRFVLRGLNPCPWEGGRRPSPPAARGVGGRRRDTGRGRWGGSYTGVR